MKKIVFNLKFRIILLLIIIAFGSLYILFNKFGLIKYVKLKKEVDSLIYRTEEVKAENKRLEAEIDSLKKFEPSKIEKIAREKYNMIKPNEKKLDVVVE